MATLQERIWERFLAELTDSNDITHDQIQRLRDLAVSGKKIKADELIRIFSEPMVEEIR